jgi:extracellular factor (EF) 3-hydroxypalmitic acid methyl ester biosynthesis protein
VGGHIELVCGQVRVPGRGCVTHAISTAWMATPPATGLFTTTEDIMTRSNAELRLLPETHDLEALENLLNRTMHSLSQRAPADGVVAELIDGLDQTRLELGDDWSKAIAACRAHPLYRVFGADPVTARARAKPRGYAGDAVMIDYIYQGIPRAERFKIGSLGAALFAATTSSSSAVAVRERRHLLTQRIDACAARVAHPRVLSLACGHLREAANSEAVSSRELGQLTAIDQDADSLAVVAEAYAAVPEIIPTQGSVRDLLRGTLPLGAHDLVYAAGLYDYLPDPIAARLTRILFDALTPGGELLIGNFAPDFPTIGYTEGFMDWRLLCRSERDLRRLCASIPADQIASIETHTDRSRCIAYLTIVRA